MTEIAASFSNRFLPAFKALMFSALAAFGGCVSAPSIPPTPSPSASASASAYASTPSASGLSDAGALPTRTDTDVGSVKHLQDFAHWVTRFAESARTSGIDEATLRSAFDDVHYLAHVVELDRAQPEFTRNVWDYLDSAVSSQRVALGRDKLMQVRPEADAAAARYGVPSSILVAIWGMESNYGSNYGNISTVDALATLGFDGRRADWARGQLRAALKILQSGDISREQMVGSWAGAMGQTQFLPSNFLAYAVDADGDGRRDIWGSMADVMHSTANFLSRSGWQAGQPWGAEVQLPPGFDYARTDAALRLSSAQWAAEGIRAIDGATLPELSEGALFLPAGARGPAFLVGANFRALLRYNNATSYALAVGLLAQRLTGGSAVQTPWPRDLTALTRNQIVTLQTALNKRGFNSGLADGVMGPATRDAIRRFQRSVGLLEDGYPDVDMLVRLQER